MKEKLILSINELQEKQTEILRYVTKLFGENGIEYYLGYGTLLGAIRHKGSIPWDADVDLLVKLEDYEKIKHCLSNSHDGYKYCDITNQHGQECFNARVGIVGYDPYYLHVDLFDMMTSPDDMYIRKRYTKHFEFLRMISYYKNKEVKRFSSFGKSVLSLLVKTLLIPINNRLILSLYMRECKMCNDEKGTFAAACASSKPLHFLFEKRIFEKSTMVEYNGSSYRAMKAYDKYLTACYGDYMKYPDEAIRQNAIDKEYVINISDR